MSLTPAGTRERLLLGILFIALAAAVAAGWYLTPDPSGIGTATQLGLPPCGLIQTRDFPCPTCGVTTAFAHGVRFDLASAFMAQPLGLMLALVAYLGGAVALLFALAGWSVRPYLDRVNWRFAFLAFFVFALACWGFKIMIYR